MGLIRLLLAISVVLAHSTGILGFKLVGGQVAVQAFFIISGFYMSLVLNEKYKAGKGTFQLFITNRFLRLFPVYWVVLLVSVGFNVFTFSLPVNVFQQFANVPLDIGQKFLLGIANIILFFQDWVMFTGIDPTSQSLYFSTDFRLSSPPAYQFMFIPQAWTIGLELTFYMVAPLILRKRLRFILLIITLSLILRIWLYYFMDLTNDPWTYRFFPTELALFLAGRISYDIYKHQKFMSMFQVPAKFLLPIVVAAILFYYKISFPFKMIIFYCFFVIALPFIFQYTKAWKFDSYIGELSYPTYIVHMLLLQMLILTGVSAANMGFYLSLVTLLAAILLNELIAKKVETIRRKRVESVKSEQFNIKTDPSEVLTTVRTVTTVTAINER